MRVAGHGTTPEFRPLLAGTTNRLACTSFYDNSLRVWDLPDLADDVDDELTERVVPAAAPSQLHAAPIRGVAFLAHPSRILTVGLDKRVCITAVQDT
jgi:WD40 repeat protein